MAASLHKHRRTTLERIEKFISTRYFTDVNLYGRLYPLSAPVGLQHWSLPADRHWKSLRFQEVLGQPFEPTAVGQSFGPTWSTHWFKVTVNIPPSWKGHEVHLRWNSGSEALLMNSDGDTLQGFTGCPDHQKREEYVISKCWDRDDEAELVYYVEMACNDMFGAGKGGMIEPPDAERRFTLQRADVAVLDRHAYQLSIDLELLHDMAKELTEEAGKGDPRGYHALYTANEIINHFQAGDVEKARRLSDEFWSVANGGRAHTIACMGHCHIDTAWLWPFDETIRKCARSWSSVLTLMKDFPQATFVCSQAQQFSWVKEFYPTLYADIKRYVADGRFIPVGGTWIEMDGNIPSGESFVRQFLHGQRFFLKEFGVRCREFWLPDTFGYSAQTPQIMQHVGITRFLTQKLSWSLVNKFPHHNFWWEGLDGSTVLVHFPPGDSYEANCRVGEALKTQRNLLDKGRVSTSAMLYGFGDGGGGPHRPMLHRLQRLQDVDGVPKMENSTPDTLFQRLEADGANLARWVGELYLELHNGTYTSQADMKKGNRGCELQLRDAELLLAAALALDKVPSADVDAVRRQLAEAWRLLLVNQFHDVLPGSSIELVHQEAKVFFAQCHQAAEQVVDRCLRYLGARGPAPPTVDRGGLFNSLPWSRDCLLYDDDVAVEAVRLAPSSWNTTAIDDFVPVLVAEHGGQFAVTNGFFSATVDVHGRLRSLLEAATGREVVAGTGGGGGWANQLVLFDDIPLFWDAWDCMDYHLETRALVNGPDQADAAAFEAVHVESATPLKVTLKWSQPVGRSSRLTQRIHFTAVDGYIEFETTVDWAENRKFLKVEFPVNVHSHQAAFDAQFGHVTRPTHRNTSWDWAKFEVCGHKWADLSEPQWGAAVLNDSKYGWNVHGRTLTLSLLRSPKSPDANCDMHQHRFRYALMPHRGVASRAEVVRAGYNFNCRPLATSARSTGLGAPFFVVGTPSVVLETVKPAETPLDDTAEPHRRLVVRLFECCGGRVDAIIRTRLPLRTVQECNGLEEPIGPIGALSSAPDGAGLCFQSAFAPFQVRSYLLSY